MIYGEGVSEWPGALSVVVPPVTEGDCARYPNLNDLMLAEYAAGRGATIRGGRCLCRATVEQLASQCAIPYPEISNVQPVPGKKSQPFEAAGVNFGASQGTVYIGDTATWSTCVLKTPVTLYAYWNDAAIGAYLPSIPPWGNVWVYVHRADGYYNENGYAYTISPF